MKRLPVFLFLILSISSFAQAPAWIESSKRSSLFPTEQYLQGYAWQSGVKKNVEETYNRLSSQAKAELIESIQVEVQSNSELQTKEIQDEFFQKYSSNTQTSAKANLVRLKIEKYYDKKQKSAYVFAYARKAEIADYYMNEISDALRILEASIRESDDFLQQGLAKEAMASILKENDQFRRINEARNFLKALGVRSESGLKTEAVAQAIQKRNKEISDILMNSKASADALSYFLAFELSRQFNIDFSKTEVVDFTYGDTPMKSEFSSTLKAAMQRSVREVKASKGANLLSDAQLKGSFTDEGNRLMVNASLTSESGNYSTDASFSKEAATNWEPQGKKYLDRISSYKFIPNSTVLESQCLETLSSELIIRVTLNDQAASNIPVAINNISSKEIKRSLTDHSGVAKFKSYRVNSCKSVQILFAEPDLATMLQIDEKDPYLKRVRNEYEIPRSKIILKVTPTLVYMESKEMYNGNPLSSKSITPLIKEKLSTSGFELTDDISKARYQISLNATARKGGNIQGLYFSYLDADLSVTDLKSGNEIINQTYSGEKQGGSNFEQAAMNAFKKTGDKMVRELTNKLFDE